MTERRFTAGRRVRLHTDDHGQAVLIPRGFELPGDEAIMRREDERPKIEPVPTQSLPAVLKCLQPLDEELPEIDDAVPEPVEV